MKLIERIVLALSGPARVGMVVAVLSFVTVKMPEPVSLYARIFNGYAILTLLLYGYVRFIRAEEQRLREAREAAAALQAHRREIVETLALRLPDIEELKRTAEDLVQRTAEVATIRHNVLAAEVAETRRIVETKAERIETAIKQSGTNGDERNGTPAPGAIERPADDTKSGTPGAF